MIKSKETIHCGDSDDDDNDHGGNTWSLKPEPLPPKLKKYFKTSSTKV